MTATDIQSIRIGPFRCETLTQFGQEERISLPIHIRLADGQRRATVMFYEPKDLEEIPAELLLRGALMSALADLECAMDESEPDEPTRVDLPPSGEHR